MSVWCRPTRMCKCTCALRILIYHCPPHFLVTMSLTEHGAKLVASKPWQSSCLCIPYSSVVMYKCNHALFSLNVLGMGTQVPMFIQQVFLWTEPSAEALECEILIGLWKGRRTVGKEHWELIYVSLFNYCESLSIPRLYPGTRVPGINDHTNSQVQKSISNYTKTQVLREMVFLGAMYIISNLSSESV